MAVRGTREGGTGYGKAREGDHKRGMETTSLQAVLWIPEERRQKFELLFACPIPDYQHIIAQAYKYSRISSHPIETCLRVHSPSTPPPTSVCFHPKPSPENHPN